MSEPVRVALIWAMSRNRVIGKDNQLPWHLPNDLRHFKRTTLGAPVIMGRRTFESTGGALPGRTNIIVTSGELGGVADDQPNVVLARSIAEALELGRAKAAADGAARCFVCGGSAVYAASLPLADDLYVTQVEAEVDGDTLFPEFDLSQWELVENEVHEADERHAYAFALQRYQRRSSAPSTTSQSADQTDARE